MSAIARNWSSFIKFKQIFRSIIGCHTTLRTPFFPASFKGQYWLYFTLRCQRSFESFNLNNSRAKAWKHVSLTSGQAIFKTQTNFVFFATNNTNSYISDCCVCKSETCPISLPYTCVAMLIPVWKVRYAFVWNNSKLYSVLRPGRSFEILITSPKKNNVIESTPWETWFSSIVKNFFWLKRLGFFIKNVFVPHY